MLWDKVLISLGGLWRWSLVLDEIFRAELHEWDLVGAWRDKVCELFQDFWGAVSIHLLVIFLVLLEKHVFKDVEEVVDALRVELWMLFLISVKVILWHISSLPWFERVAGHVDESYRADCIVFMPEVQLDEHVCFVTRWITAGTTMLTTGFLEVITALLDSFQKEQ